MTHGPAVPDYTREWIWLHSNDQRTVRYGRHCSQLPLACSETEAPVVSGSLYSLFPSRRKSRFSGANSEVGKLASRFVAMKDDCSPTAEKLSRLGESKRASVVFAERKELQKETVRQMKERKGAAAGGRRKAYLIAKLPLTNEWMAIISSRYHCSEPFNRRAV